MRLKSSEVKQNALENLPQILGNTNTRLLKNSFLVSIADFYWTLADLSVARISACLIVVLVIIVVASYLNSLQCDQMV